MIHQYFPDFIDQSGPEEREDFRGHDNLTFVHFSNMCKQTEGFSSTSPRDFDHNCRECVIHQWISTWTSNI